MFSAVPAVTSARIGPASHDDFGDQQTTKKNRSETRDQKCEAKLYQEHDAECQTSLQNDVGVQAEPSKFVTNSNSKRDSGANKQSSEARLATFIHNVTPMFMQALIDNLHTEAFDNWRLRTLHRSQEITEVCQLDSTAQQFEVSSVAQLSWNASGSLLSVACGGMKHAAFCTHRAGVIVYKVLRFTSGHREPFCVLDTQSCVMCVAFNPKTPTLLGAGTFNGEVIVWDLEAAATASAATDSKIIASTGIMPDVGHREPITSLCWILKDLANAEAYQLLSCSLDGKAILWKKPAGGAKELRPHIGLVLVSDDLLRVASRFSYSKLPKGKPIGISAMAYTREDNSAFLIGSENGAIIRCKRSGLKADIKETISYSAALSIGYRSSTGPINDLCYSQIEKDLFLCVASDGVLKLFHLRSAKPVLELRLAVSGDYNERTENLLCCDFSPARPAVFAVGTASGSVLVFDLMQNLTAPVVRLHITGGGDKSSSNNNNSSAASIDSVKFNPKQQHLLAAGNRAGSVKIWNLSEALTEVDAGEIGLFQKFVAENLA